MSLKPVLTSESWKRVVLKATISLVEATKQPQGQHHFNPSNYHIHVCAIVHNSCFFCLFFLMDVPRWCCELAMEYHVTPLITHILIVGFDNGTACHFTISIIMQYQINFQFTILCDGLKMVRCDWDLNEESTAYRSVWICETFCPMLSLCVG